MLLLAGCRGDEILESPDAPAVYYDLLDAMTAGKRLDGVERTGESTMISFSDGSRLEIPLKELFIYDCTESDPVAVTVNNATGTWMIGQKDTGIHESASASARDCKPVYAWFTWTTVSMTISNGETLTIRGPSASGKHRLPVIRITTDGNRSILDKETYVPGSIVFEDPDCLYSEVPYLECRMGIRGRGNTSWSFEKKSWKVKLDEKQTVFGFHKDKDWALLANYSDKTLLRNMVAMELSRIVGMRWTPAMVSTEVYLNGQYQGCYVLSEHKEVSKEKVDIQPATDQDNEGEAVTGDYYIEIDGHQDEPFWFWTGVGIPVMLKRGIAETIDEWLGSAEYIMSEGNYHIMMCERGIRTFETATRSTLDISAVPVLKGKTHLPIIVDPSHAAGKAQYVQPLALAAVAAGADGLIIEVHPDPKHALSDAAQQLTPDAYAELALRVKEMAAIVKRSYPKN